MSVLALGLSHRSAPVTLLERVALSGEVRLKLMTEMVNTSAVNEAMVVSTCNRTEVYADVDQFHPGVAAICELLSQYTGVSQEELTQHCYVHYEERAVQHLFSVACGLDSMVVGEGQILGQVRNALKDAQHVGTLGRVLNDLGQRALRVGKRAHTETRLDKAGASMVSFGLTVAGRFLTPDREPQPSAAAAVCPVDGDTGVEVSAALPDPQLLTGRRIMVLGAGSMSALAANTVARHGASTILIANRTFNRAQRLAECLTEGYESVRSSAVPFEDAARHLADIDLVISCTGAQGIVLTAEQVAAGGDRATRPLVFLDLALPHDIDKAVRKLPGVHLVDIEELRDAAEDGTATGQVADLTAVRDIVAEEVAEYHAVRSAERVAPTVVALRSKAQKVVESELERLNGRLPGIDDRTRAEITRTVRRVVDKLLHQPTVRVKQLATGPEGAVYAEALRELFDLDPAIPSAVVKPGTALGEER